MPIKEFECLSCKEVFEVLILKKGEEEDLSCPRCGGKKLTKLLSLFAKIGGDREAAFSQTSSSCSSCSGKSCSACH